MPDPPPLSFHPPLRMNPLNLPEIITKVGHFLPLWKQNQNLGFYDFSPAFLLSCTLVNKTWHDALLPVIWYVYKGDTMRSIPNSVLIKNSRHFQIFIHDRSFSGPFQCTHLKELAIIWWDDQLLSLVRANAETLQDLAWKGSSSPTRVRSSTFPELDYDLFARMAPNLRSLQLSHWTLSGRRFLQFLSQCKQLTDLCLATVDWTDPTPVTSPLNTEMQSYGFPSHYAPSYPHQSFQHSFYRHHSSPPSSPHQQQLQYYYSSNVVGIKQLRLDISLSKEDAFTDLVRCCRELEFFSLLSESSEDIKTLIPILRQSCPLLRGIDYISRFSSALGNRDYLSDPEYADLVLCSTHGLAHLKIDIPWLGESLTRAILVQSPYLTNLQLRFYEDRVHDTPMVDAVHLTRILEHCAKLTSLALHFSAHSLGMEETGRVLQGPWACTGLESLVLSGVTIVEQGMIPSNRPFPWQVGGHTGGMVDVGGAMHVPTMPGFLQHLHPHPPAPPPAQGLLLTKQRLFERVQQLPKLAKLSLNSVTFSLDGITALV
ncbi:hypothetical protein CPB97_006082 [Podila verticillata]|nr:hypothetical protein CPB97_006082 [Podila verticillata]